MLILEFKVGNVFKESVIVKNFKCEGIIYV